MGIDSRIRSTKNSYSKKYRWNLKWDSLPIKKAPEKKFEKAPKILESM